MDRAGARHPWQINHAHALLWDGQPYLPAGVVLHLANRGVAAAAALKTAHDRGAPTAETSVSRLPSPVSKALDLLSAHGIKDLCVVREGSWLAEEPAADQALVDALEARGLRYGVSLDARPRRPLSGFAAVPTRIEVPAAWVQPGRRLTWNVQLPGARAALYLLIDVENESTIAAGRVTVSEGQAQIAVPLRPAKRMFAPGPARLLVVSDRELTGPPEERPIDFWSGWEDTQQALARRLAAVRWGPGLRFFARPAATPFGLRGEAEELIPSSGAFRLRFESWIERHYSVADLNTQWALNDRAATSFIAAARLVPLWGRNERAEKTGWLLDPVSMESYRVDLRRCRFWRDLDQFRADSIRRALNQTATLIKKTAADVPVLWQWSEYHPLFTDSEEGGGLDGLAFTPLGRGREAAVGTAAYAYAQAEESGRPTWFVQLGQQWNGAAPPASAEELRLDWNWLREIGCKGFFLDGIADGGADRAPAAEASTNSGMSPAAQGASRVEDLARTPERLDWIRDFAENVTSGPRAADYRPIVLYFPSSAAGTLLTGRMDNGVWWLPSMARGVWLTLGSDIEGYWIERAPDPAPTGSTAGVAVLWANAGPTKATFVVPENAPVRVYDVGGQALKQEPKRGRLELSLAPVPVLVTGLPLQSLFPVETTAQALREFEAMVKAAEAQKMDVAAFRLALNQAKTVFSPATAATAYQLIQTPLGLLRASLTPYIWIEGEAAAGHNWSGVQPAPQASAGSLLRLDRAADAPAGSTYQARWAVTVAREANYDLWLAGSIPGGAEVAGFTWRIDDQPPRLATSEAPARRYASDLGWTRLGQVLLTPGPHTLVIAATEPARNGGYHLAVDALVLSREPFEPNGVRRPAFRLARQAVSEGHERR